MTPRAFPLIFSPTTFNDTSPTPSSSHLSDDVLCPLPNSSLLPPLTFFQIFTATGLTPQIFAAYSRIDRSDENRPILATLRIERRVHSSWSR